MNVGTFRAYIDLLSSVLLVLFALVLLAKPTDPDKLLQPPGNMFIYTTWADKGGDVDTWLLGPTMALPVGYDNKDSSICNLVKDDMGQIKDAIGVNYENIFCRQTPDGEYILNVHAYNVKTLPCEVNIQVAMNVNGVMTVLFNEKVTFTSPRQEVTVIRFKLKDGVVVPGSTHHTFISLYEMKVGHQ